MSDQIIAIHVFKSRWSRAVGAGIKWSCAKESQCCGELWLSWKESVCGELLLHKSLPGFILVERSDHIIAKPPGMRAMDIVLKTMRVGKMNRVEPVPRPAFSILWRGQQPIHQFFIRRRIVVGSE